MTRPPGWEWLDDLPDEWEAPSDLQGPTPYPEVNLTIQLLSCEFLGFDVRVAIGRFVTQEALYDMWFIENVESAGWGMKKAAQLREVPMEQTRVIYEAWRVLDSISTLEAPNDVLLEQRVSATAALRAALEESERQFIRIRSDNSLAS